MIKPRHGIQVNPSYMPTTENDRPSGSIPLALRSSFTSDSMMTITTTKELTKSFEWGVYDPFMQHDVQKLNRFLCEKQEDEI